jgi:phage minor structural protein, N-terminal domain protein|uniref:Neck appendage protein n=2 Tax=unclassified Caudoviricetes TaxID=2788787 RepID=A0A8S5N8Q0_9CAUD|nr:MAG TPA: Neck appendage protein [Siphoviridae sp. ctkTE1]DAE10419.1 MAG TPA: Neck appendage protein [Siphoviridae sp. ct2A828]
MIYLTDGNIPLNAAYADEIVQIDRNTYQLTFKFPTNNVLWQRLREETFLTADDLHGEQDFVIFEVEKQHGYIQVYANQVMTLLNHYVVNPINLDRATGSTALSRFAGSITRDNPFSFFSDIDDRHTFNTDTKNAMEVLTKDKHSILGQWGGDLVRHGYQVRLLKNGGSENESLFMYKKNLSSYQHKTSTKSLKTRITFKTTVKGEGENADDKHYKVVVDSPLINKYSQIYEDVVEVNDQDVKDEASLREYGKQYFRTSLCDLMEDSLEIDVVGQSDVPVQMFDVVSVYHETFDLDVRKKITKYTYSPMAKKLKSIGFGEFKSGLAHAIGNVVSDAVKNETYIFETRLEKEIKNADLDFDRKVQGIKNEITDGIEQAKAVAEENKKKLSDVIDSKFNVFDTEINEKLDDQKNRIQALHNFSNQANYTALEALHDAKIALDYARSTNGLADSNFTQISQINDTIETLARKSELDPLNDRLSITESKIEVQAGQITEKLSRTEVDKLVNDKGFQTATQVQNTVKKSVDGFQRTISRIETKLRDVIRNDNLLQNSSTIPTGNGLEGTWRPNISGGNGRTEVVSLTDAPHTAIKKCVRVVGNTNGGNKDFGQFVNLEIGQKYTISCWARVHSNSSQNNVNFLMRSYTSNDRNRILIKNISNRDWVRYQLTFTADAVNNSIQFGQSGSGSLELCGMKIERSDRMTDYDVSNSEIVSIVEFNDVRDTVSSHTQTLQRQDQAISQVIQTADGLVSRVSNFLDDFNLVYDPTNFSKWEKTAGEANVIEVQSNTKLLRITSSGNTTNVYRGFRVPLNTSNFTEGEKISYRMFVWVDVVPDAPLVMDLWSADAGLASTPITLTQKGQQVITGTFTIKKTTNKGKEFPLEILLTKNGQVAIGQISLIRGDRPPKKFTDNTSKQDVVTQTRVAQLSDSYAIQTLTSPGAVTSQINLAPKDILLEASRIRLKGSTLADEITAIDGYFKRLFVGDARIGKLNTDIIESNSITADKMLMNLAMAKKFVSSDVFTDTLAAKTAFINKLRSVVVSATLLEGFKGRIGGFQIGTHDKDPNTYWLTGINQFAVGMSNGSSRWGQTALWVNWGENWNTPGKYAWYVKRTGEMFCYNKAYFWNTPIIHGDLKVTGNIYYTKENYIAGFWTYSDIYTNFKEQNGYFYMYKQGGGYSWIPINKEISDRRYKSNIEESKVSALEVINRLKTYSYRKEYDGKIEDISCGIMAQDVQKYVPEAFYKNPDGAYSYHTFELVPYLIKAIQELNKKLEKVNEGRN